MIHVPGQLIDVSVKTIAISAVFQSKYFKELYVLGLEQSWPVCCFTLHKNRKLFTAHFAKNYFLL